jgi:DNA-binding CsgD family transcriptional regulator
VTAPVRVLEREAELRLVEAAFDRAAAGHGSLLVIEGPAGIGKSALLGAARAAARRRDLRVLAARGAELERDFAFGVARQLLEPALAAAVAAGRDVYRGPAGAAGRVLALPGASDDAPGAAREPPDASFGILHGLYWLCAELAGGDPLVLVVDDAQWADAPSLRFLAFLAPRLDELPVTVLVATAPDADAIVAPLLGALRGDRAAQVLRPAPLSPAAVGELIAERLDRAPAPAFAAACHAATGGLPFLVRELLAAVAEEGVEPVAAAAPGVDALGGGTIRRAISLRLARLPASAAELAQALAVLETAELAQAAVLAGLDEDGAAAAADLLVAAGIVEPRLPLAFVHPVVREAVLAELPAPGRARAHRQAAELLAARDVPDERVAEHLLATEPAGERWVLERLTAAARTATGRGAPDCAATYLRRALAEPPAAEARPELLLQLGLAETAAGQGAGEARLREACATAADDGVRLPAALALAHLLGRAERMAEAVEVVDAAAAALTDPADPAASRLEAIALGAGILDAATAPALAARLDVLRRAAEAPDASRDVLGVAALVALHRNEPAVAVIALAQRSLAAGPRIVPDPTDLPWFSQATIALLWADAHHQVQVPLDAGIAEGRRRDDAALLSTSLAHRSWLLLRRGDLTGAEADARAVLEIADAVTPLLYRRAATAILGNALIEQGRLGEAAGLLADLGDVDTESTHPAAVLRLARGRLRLAERRPAEALADALAAGDIALRSGARSPGFLAWRSAAALAHAALGEREAALAAAEEEVGLARAFGGRRTLGVALRTAGVVAGGDEGERLLRESVGCFAEAGVTLERGRALAELGALLRRSNRRREARELLAEALDGAHHAGAAMLAEHVETELRATGARPRRAVLRGVASLTASERRVAELAADGLTNREIAQALFVTMRTVEGHLTRVFAKLDVSSRRDLPARLSSG